MNISDITYRLDTVTAPHNARLLTDDQRRDIQAEMERQVEAMTLSILLSGMPVPMPLTWPPNLPKWGAYWYPFDTMSGI